MELGRQQSQRYLRNLPQCKRRIQLKCSQQRIYLLSYVHHCGKFSLFLREPWRGRDDRDGYGRGSNAVTNPHCYSHRNRYRHCHGNCYSHRYRRDSIFHRYRHSNDADTNPDTNTNSHPDSNANPNSDTDAHTNAWFLASSALPARYHRRERADQHR